MTANLSSMSDALTRVDELVTIVDELQAKLAAVADDLRAIEGFLDAFELGAGSAAAGCAMGVASAALDRMGEPHFEEPTKKWRAKPETTDPFAPDEGPGALWADRCDGGPIELLDDEEPGR